MKTKKISISEAASQFGLARKTVQRAVSSGLLSWEGPRRGRYACGLDSEEVAAKLCGDERRSSAPSYIKIIENIERARGDWRLVFGALMKLINQGPGTDLDLVAAAFACLNSPHRSCKDFVSVLDGRHPGGWSYSRAGLRVGFKVMECLADFDRIPDYLTARDAWADLRDLLLSNQAPQSQARPRFFFDLPGCKWPPRSISFKLVPSWDAWPKDNGGGKWKLGLPGFDESSLPETVGQRLQKMKNCPRQRVDAALGRLCALAQNYESEKRFNEEVFGLILFCFKCGKSRKDEQYKQLIADSTGYHLEDIKILNHAWNALRPRFSSANRVSLFDDDNDFDKALESVIEEDSGGIYEIGDSRKSYSAPGKGKKSNMRLGVATVARVMGVSATAIRAAVNRDNVGGK